MTNQPTCLIQKTNCGRIAGNPICPKCGADEQLRYTTQDAVMLANAQASAKYWQNEATEVAHHSAVAEAQRQELERLKAEEAKRQAENERQEAAQRRKVEEAKRQAEEEKQRLAVELAKRKLGQVFQDHPTAPQMVVLPSGSYLMGSESTGWLDKVFGLGETPKHKVTISHSLAIGRYPVTFEEWDACVADGGVDHKPKDEGWGRGQRPVINVSWDDAQAYIAWLNKKLGLAATDPTRYRLPSEAEWEYACRAGSQTEWCFGDDKDRLKAHAWYDANSNKQTQPVGQKQTNSFGLQDMHGNVWEWVQDNFVDNSHENSLWKAGSPFYLLRGGSWDSNAKNTHAVTCINRWHSNRDGSVGFRLARTLP